MTMKVGLTILLAISGANYGASAVANHWIGSSFGSDLILKFWSLDEQG